ncbi:MAG: hypothetical protein AAF690_06875 [Acidobacteriota bacterium]
MIEALSVGNVLELLAALLGVLGFLLSAILAYLSHFRAARIEILPGNRLQFYPAPSQGLNGVEFLGGVGFYLPVTIHNWSDRGGVLYKLRLVLAHEGATASCYDMKWAEFAELSTDERRWVSKRVAQALPIDGKSSRTEMIQFQWQPGGLEFEVLEGDYDVRVLAWTKPTLRPQVVFSTHTTLTSQQAANYVRAIELKKPLTIELLLGEDSEWTRSLTRQQFRDNYGQSI